MARLTPEGNIRVHFVPTVADTAAPTESEIGAGVELTGWIAPAGILTPDEGTEADTSDLGSPRDKSIPSTISGNIEMELYRDDYEDAAWEALSRETEGYLIVAPFGGTGTGGALQEGDSCEVWTTRVSNRNPLRYTRGDAYRFQCTCTVEADPVYDAVITT